jgi:hypothetical protein
MSSSLKAFVYPCEGNYFTAGGWTPLTCPPALETAENSNFERAY